MPGLVGEPENHSNLVQDLNSIGARVSRRSPNSRLESRLGLLIMTVVVFRHSIFNIHHPRTNHSPPIDPRSLS